MKKDQKFLNELNEKLGNINTKKKDAILLKYKNIIEEEKKNGKKITVIIKSFGNIEEIAKKEIELNKKSDLPFKIKNIFNKKSKDKGKKSKIKEFEDKINDFDDKFNLMFKKKMKTQKIKNNIETVKEKIEKDFTNGKPLEAKGINLEGMSKISLVESSVGISTMVVFIAIYLGIVFLIASSAILALKQLTESSDNKQRYLILRKIGCDEKMINQALFRQIGIFFMMPLVLAIIHSIFGIQFATTIFEGLTSKSQLLPSIISTVIIMVVVYGLYFIATYAGSKNIIKE